MYEKEKKEGIKENVMERDRDRDLEKLVPSKN